eukprot:8654546-Alexandrium_andersonii.AAC.1
MLMQPRSRDYGCPEQRNRVYWIMARRDVCSPGQLQSIMHLFTDTFSSCWGGAACDMFAICAFLKKWGPVDHFPPPPIKDRSAGQCVTVSRAQDSEWRPVRMINFRNAGLVAAARWPVD